MKKCANCGAEAYRVESKFCLKCGAALPSDEQGAASEYLYKSGLRLAQEQIHLPGRRAILRRLRQ